MAARRGDSIRVVKVNVDEEPALARAFQVQSIPLLVGMKGRAVVIPISDKTRGHSTHSFPSVWGDELARLLLESEPKP